MTLKLNSTLARLVEAPLLAAGYATVFALIILTFLDVAARNILNVPVKGALEISQYWLMIPMVAVGIWWGAVSREHVKVTLLKDVLGDASLRLMEAIALIVSIFFLALCVKAGLGEAAKQMSAGEYTGAYNTTVWPMRYVSVAGLAAFAIVLAIQVKQTLFDDISTIRGASDGSEQL